MCALHDCGRLPTAAYEGATMYTTMPPCIMCTGACILYKMKRVVIAEDKTFNGGQDLLLKNGVEVVVLDNEEVKQLMYKFIEDKPEIW